jgi:hypothetical protein
MKNCKYRNCKNNFDDDKKLYCCRRCKNSEAVYRLRDNKPKGKVGRPRHTYKRLNEITEDDIRILKLVMN